MKRVGSAPELAGAAGSGGKGLSTHPQPVKAAGVVPAKHSQMRGSAVITSALPIDALATDGPPPPAAEMVYAVSAEGFQTLECLPTLEMKDAPSLDLAVCMASPMVPDEGPGAEVRQRAAAMANQAESELRLRYAQEVAARTALRVTRMRSRKRSLDDLDLQEALQEANAAASGSQDNDKGTKNASPSKTKRLGDSSPGNGVGRRSNVVPFRRPGAAIKKVPVTTQTM